MKVPIGMIISTNLVRPDNATRLYHSVISKDLRTYPSVQLGLFFPKESSLILIEEEFKNQVHSISASFLSLILLVVIHYLLLNHVYTQN